MECITVCLPAAGVDRDTLEIRKSSKSRRDDIIVARNENVKTKSCHIVVPLEKG